MAKKGAFFWLSVAGGGCVGLPILLVIGLCGLWKGADYLFTLDDVAAVREQLAEIRRGNMEKAYRRMNGCYRAMNDLEDFEAFVAVHPALKDNRDATFWHRRNREAASRDTWLDHAVLTSRSGVTEVFDYHLSREGISISPVVDPSP
jgi:hypothetical protein